MNYKIISAVFILIFFLATVAGLKSNTTINKIQFKNQSFQVNTTDTKITNTDVEFSLSESKLKNSQVKTSSQSSKVKLGNSKINNNNLAVKNKSVKYDNNSVKNKNISGQIKRPRYLYKNISWNEWKSDFINKFLDDLNQVQSLNKYGLGSWFYYSFDVMNDGSIRNIKIFSFYINSRDKNEIIELIKKYEYQEITIFPQNSKRKKAKVDAVVVLSTEESRTNPSDFNDHERVRLEY